MADVFLNDLKMTAFFCTFCFDPLKAAEQMEQIGLPNIVPPELADDPEVARFRDGQEDARVIVRALAGVTFARTGVDLAGRTFTFKHAHEAPFVNKCHDSYACVYRGAVENLGRKATVYFTGQILFRPPMGIDSWAGTMLHEVSHLAAGTVDTWYGCVPALGLAVSPVHAVRNADNYTFFAESVSITCASRGNGGNRSRPR
jgi:hypothetical protein